MGLIAWMILGLIAGGITKANMPDDDPGGSIVPLLLGILGAVLGGFLWNILSGRGASSFTLGSIVLAVIGALILLVGYRVAAGRRAA